MRQIAVETDEQFAPGCFIVCLVDESGNWDMYDESKTVLVQTDRDFPNLARTLGGPISDYEIEKATGYINEHCGIIVPDCGYFGD